MELSSILGPDGLGLAVVAPPAAMGGGEDALDAEFVTAEAMVLLTLIAGVAEKRVEAMARVGLEYQGRELDDVAPRSTTAPVITWLPVSQIPENLGKRCL